MSGELGVDETSVEAVTGAGGIPRSQRDAGNVMALPVPYRSGAGAAAFNDDGVHETSECVQGVLDCGGAGEPQRFVGVRAKMSTCARVSHSMGVSRVPGTSWQSMNTCVPSGTGTLDCVLPVRRSLTAESVNNDRGGVA